MDNVKPYQLNTTSTLAALEALRQGRPIASDHPLSYFLSLNEPILASLPLSKSLQRDMQIYEGLSQVIRRKLNEFRTFYSLPPAVQNEEQGATVHMLQSDFRQENPELEAWSLLYHRFVVDMGLSVEKICRATSQVKRTLNRRQALGIVRLTHILIKQELLVRDKYFQQDRIQLTSENSLPHISRN